ncbi:hypothetical protein AAMO2058_000157700 [Amorphochlora amoebiformis]
MSNAQKKRLLPTQHLCPRAMGIFDAGKQKVIDGLCDEIWEKMPCFLKCLCCCCCSTLDKIKSLNSCCSCLIPTEARESVEKLMKMLD